MPYNFQNVGIIKTIFPCAKSSIFTEIQWIIFFIIKTYFSNNTHPYTYDLNNIYNFYKIYKKFMTFWNKIYFDSIFNIEYESLVLKPEENIKKIVIILRNKME